MKKAIKKSTKAKKAVKQKPATSGPRSLIPPKAPPATGAQAALQVVANDIKNPERCPAFHVDWGQCVKPKNHEGNHARDPKPDCPVPKCDKTRHPNQLMCLGHWRRVPKVNQKAVWETYAAAPRSLNYCRAADDAIAAVAAKEGNPVDPARTFTKIFYPDHKAAE